jgi:hypothetical protein
MKTNFTRLGQFASHLTLALFTTGSIAATPPATVENVLASNLRQKALPMKIRLTMNGRTTTATLEDNATVRDFLTLLPITLALDDYHATEKIANLPRKLSIKGAPAGIDPAVGDITYYAPWGNIAFFYRNFGYSSGLIRLGRFDADTDLLNTKGKLQLTIEAAE